MYDLLIKNGTIVDEETMYSADIYIKDQKIAKISSGSECLEAEQEVDASGMLIFAGAVDGHMHIGEYQADFEDMQTSTMAAAAGGVTTCIDMPLNLYTPSVLTAEAVELKKQLLSEESYTDFCIWGGLTPASIPRLKDMHEAGAISFKSFLSAGGNDFAAPTMGEVREALKIIQSFDGLAGFHCEDYSIITYEKNKVISQKIDGRQAFLDSRPLVSELIATQDIIELARETKARVHICHVSHPKVAQLIEQAQNDGVDITAETCAHFLTFTDKDYLENGCAYGCAPPLRDQESRDSLWDYVAKGVIGCVASDHSPGLLENRSDEHQPTYRSGYGISGVQTMFQTIYDQAVNKRGFSPTLLAKCMSANPARRWGLYGVKGAVKEGFDADLILFNPEKKWKVDQEKLFYKVKLTAFHGLEGTGAIEKTFIRGTEVYNGAEILVQKGFGKLVR